MAQLKLKICELRARMLRPLAGAAPYILCTAILVVGIFIGFAGAKIEATDTINRLNEDHQAEIIRLQASQGPFLDLIARRVEEAVTKALEAARLAREAVDKAR